MMATGINKEGGSLRCG